MQVKGLSASSIESFNWCNWRFMMNQILGFEDESGPSATIGHIGHKFLEILTRASIVKHDPKSKIWNFEYLLNACFNHYYNDLPHVCEKIKNPDLKKLALGLEYTLNSIYTPVRDNSLCAEVSFNIDIKEPSFIIKNHQNQDDIKYLKIRGKIDRVDKIDDETIEIIDYKTGTRSNFESKDRSKKDEIYLYKQFQPRIYHYACRYLYPWAKNVLVTFFYMTDGGPITIPFHEEDAIETTEMLRQQHITIKTTTDPQKNITWKCKNFCSYGKSGLCDEIWNEKEKFGLDFIQEKYTVLNYKRKYRK